VHHGSGFAPSAFSHRCCPVNGLAEVLCSEWDEEEVLDIESTPGMGSVGEDVDHWEGQDGLNAKAIRQVLV
jgi:hypothetical protein